MTLSTTIPLIPEPQIRGRLQLYPHQAAGIEATRQAARAGHKRQILCAPTGSGKTECAIYLLDEARKRGSRVAFIVDSIPLVRQTHNRLSLYGIPHGIAQGRKNTRGGGEKVQVWSAQTAEARNLIKRGIDLVIFDECFHPSVEILTAIGWRRFDQLPEGIRVAQWDSGAIEFMVPTGYIKRPFNGDLIRLHSDSLVDLSMTPGHELLLQYPSGHYKKEPVCSARFNSQKRIPVAGQAVSQGGHELTPFERLMIAFQADGNLHNETKSANCTLSFSLVKQRKIDRLQAICRYGDYRIKELADSNSTRRRFMIYDILNATKAIADHFQLSELGYEKARAIIAEMVEWDGSKIKDGGLYYSSTDEAAVDFYQAVAVLAGYKARKTVQHDQRSESYSDVHRLFISPQVDRVTTQALKRSPEPYAGFVYCVEVPSGSIVVRRNGKVMVTGNCHVQWEKLMKQAAEDDIHVLGLTATPLTRRLGDYYSHVTNVVTTDWLLNNVNPQTEQPYLAPLRIYSGVATTEIDMEGAEIGSDGEYTDRAVRERGRVVIGDVVKEWDRMCCEHFGRWVKTLVFSADVAHGEELCAAFQAIGADARQSTYRDSEEETTHLVEDFAANKFDVLVSVCKFIKGFDDPTVMCVVDVRKNRASLSEVIQKMGRAMRYAPGKEYALYLDRVRNMEDWYYRILDVWENGVNVLHTGKDKKPRPKQTSREERPDVTCFGCGLVLLPGMDMCPACGRIRSRRTTKAVTVEGTLREFRQAKSTEWMKDEPWVWSQLSRLALERREGDVEAAQESVRGYYKGMYGGWPSWGRPLVPCECHVDERVMKRVTYNLIRYQHSQKRRNGT